MPVDAMLDRRYFATCLNMLLRLLPHRTRLCVTDLKPSFLARAVYPYRSSTTDITHPGRSRTGHAAHRAESAAHRAESAARRGGRGPDILVCLMTSFRDACHRICTTLFIDEPAANPNILSTDLSIGSRVKIWSTAATFKGAPREASVSTTMRRLISSSVRSSGI